MDWGFVEKVTDLMDLGDEIEVMITDIDRDNRIRLSRKALLEKPEGYVEPEKKERREGGGRGGRERDRGRGGRERDRGRGGRERDRGSRGGDRSASRGANGERGGYRDREREDTNEPSE
jgi:polyribonucleotide nucleotidyltransferase